MRILVSNDDGVHAPGIKALAEVLRPIAEIFVVAPDRDRSGASNSLSLDNPLRAHPLENGFVSVNGTPTDCVHLAINGWLDTVPDMVVSGINSGANLGDDVIYSGTVAAAMEGRFLGLPALAFSLAKGEFMHYDTAARVARIFVSAIIADPLPKDTILNINIPNVPFNKLKGTKVVRLGQRHKAEGMVKDIDPRDKEVYWIGLPGLEQDSGEGTDFCAIREGYISVTPLQVDLTRHSMLPRLNTWINDIELS